MSEQEETEAKYSLYCSFCEKSNQDVSNLFTTNGHYICNECVLVIVEMAIRRPQPEQDPGSEEPSK